MNSLEDSPLGYLKTGCGDDSVCRRAAGQLSIAGLIDAIVSL